MKKYLIGTMLCLSSLNLMPSEAKVEDSDPEDDHRTVAAAVQAATAPTPQNKSLVSSLTTSTASTTPVDYNEIMNCYGYTKSLASKPAVIGAASGLIVARLVKASMPVTVALAGAGYGIGVMHAANSKLHTGLLLRNVVLENRTVARASSNGTSPEPSPQLENYCYGEPVPVNPALVPPKLYKKIVEKMPICCVDVFVYDRAAKKYFMVKRAQEPMKGFWWLPGGRLNFGEAPADCAKRKCKDEVGLTVDPVATLGAYSTVFDTSAWGSSTHTVNMAVLAYGDASKQEKLDQNHEESTWVDIKISPNMKNEYVYSVYQAAKARLPE